ncbi:hypothetical protein E2C01_006528 [Portunus trituberculatus]|uniref:Uncharacterized protein n=1 Tax=Portunus trituberculatus TaxID=210409 RepID=A0A5B7CYE9_PORTR|nr:hypothetical protein [Portunus trituberculatus]
MQYVDTNKWRLSCCSKPQTFEQPLNLQNLPHNLSRPNSRHSPIVTITMEECVVHLFMVIAKNRLIKHNVEGSSIKDIKSCFISCFH